MHTYEVKLKLLHKIFFGLLVFGLLFSQSSLSNTELEQLIKQSGLSENDMKNLIQNENFESLIPKNSNQLNLEDPIDSDLSNDSKEIVFEVINSNSSR